MFDDKTRKGPSSTLISKPPLKATTTTTTMKPKSKGDIIEPEIDIENVPILQGSFEVTKTDADITEKKTVRTSTLKPFTITNGSVRMKPKKTTIEKIKPLSKVPENLTASILKLENVTRPIHYEKVTTARAPTTTEEAQSTTNMMFEIHSSSEATTTSKPPSTTIVTSISYHEEIGSGSTVSTATTTTTTEKFVSSVVLPSDIPSSPVASVESVPVLEGEMLLEPKKKNMTYPSSIVLDDQPWQPIQPNGKPADLSDMKKKIHNSMSPPVVSPSYNTDSGGFQSLPRNKIRNPISSSVQKTSRPPIYHGFNNPALMYGLHEVERLGGSFVKPFQLPVDLIGDQAVKKGDNLSLNKGEVLPSIKESQPTSTESNAIKVNTTPIIEKAAENNKTESSMTLNIEETTNRAVNKTQPQSEEDVSSDQQVGEILLDLLKESNVKLNDSSSEDLLQSRTDDMDLPEPQSSDVQNQTEKTLLTDEIDHTEALDEIATVLTSMETLSFKNIKDYIMATTKSISKEVLATSTERDQTAPRKEKPQNAVDPVIKFDRIGALPMPTIPAAIIPRDRTTPTAMIRFSTTTPTSVSTHETGTEPVTTSFVEVETVQYTPVGSSWSPGLFPVQAKWEIVNGSLVYPSVAPMRKVFNDTLKAWIIENPTEVTERPPPTELIRNPAEPIKNISAIFDTLASKLSINTMENGKLPPFMSHYSSKHKNEPHSPSMVEHVPLNTVTKKPTSAPTAPSTAAPSSVSTSETTPEEELPVLLSQNTESYYGSSSETLIGQAEVEEVDPTQYEQMLLIDRVSAALRPSSTESSLVTLLPVKSNSGIRQNFMNPEKVKGSARGFSQSTSNRRRFEDASFVVRTSMNISS